MLIVKKIILGKQGGDRQIDSLNTFVQIKINFPGLPFAAHLNSSEHSIFNAKVSVATSCVNDTHRKTEEERLIYKLGTLEPRGMNVRFHSSPVSIVTP